MTTIGSHRVSKKPGAEQLSRSDLDFLALLSDPVSFHALVCNSISPLSSAAVSESEPRSSQNACLTSALLLEETQLYMKRLLHVLQSSRECRARIPSPDCLTYLECLTNPSTQIPLIQLASGSTFLSAIVE